MRTTRVVALTLLGFVLAAAVLSAGCSLGPKVPDVTGKSAADAVRLLQDAGYKLGATNRVHTPGVAPGVVFRQNPVAGVQLSKGEAVSITVALPLGEFIVPAVTGKTAEEASASIAANSLVPMPIDEFNDTVPAGTVVGQVPDAGAKVNLHARVAYVVSQGKAPASSKVPNIVGKSKADAEKAIKDAGLVPDAEAVYSTTVANGNVVIQSPAPGATAAPGATVSYAISLGAPASSVSVPSVTGRSEADAVSSIQAAGLAPKVYRQSSASVAKGVVIGQMPPAGTQTAKGGTIGIEVSTGPEALVGVPNVTGKSESEARSAIESAGFVVETTDQPSADVAKGTVVAQLPVSGSKAPAGSTVVLAISSGRPAPQ
ncbi:MAG: PASTA domain-containing protein [Coriobacteriia bacterium]|nr:PASTA domain-containing protein [Coriobacteriia bacterium]